MLSADHLPHKLQYGAQHDLGIVWHSAFCAAEPHESLAWPSSRPLNKQTNKQELGEGGKTKRKMKTDQEKNNSVWWSEKQWKKGMLRVRKRWTVGRG